MQADLPIPVSDLQAAEVPDSASIIFLRRASRDYFKGCCFISVSPIEVGTAIAITSRIEMQNGVAKMKIMFQAVRAVSVELAGVVLVSWLLIHVASWGLRSTIGYESHPGWNQPAKHTVAYFVASM